MKSYLNVLHSILLASSFSAFSQVPCDFDEGLVPKVNAALGIFEELDRVDARATLRPLEYWRHGRTPPPDEYGRYILKDFTDSDKSFLGKSFSIVVWAKIDRDEPAERTLLGIKGRKGEFVWLGVDRAGVPEWKYSSATGVKTTVSATAGRSPLNDGRWHCIIAICDKDTGLIRLYLNSRPEAAKALRNFEMSETESVLAFQCDDLAGFSQKNHFVPRILDGELSELDILQFPSADFFSSNSGLTSLPSFSEKFQKLITERALIFASPYEKLSAARIRIIRRTYDH